LLRCTVFADLPCLETKSLWTNNISSVNELLYSGYRDGNPQKEIGEFPAGNFFSPPALSSRQEFSFNKRQCVFKILGV
jgi:hypothetical protein